MIKIRNKRIALLLVLAMLATMFVGVGTASAATNYTEVNSTYTYVEADDDQPAGDISISSLKKFNTQYLATNPDTIYIEVTLPEGVTFDDSDDTYETSFAFNDDDYNWDMNDTTTKNFTISNNVLDIDSDVTGTISASVRVWGTANIDDQDVVVFEEAAESTPIAKISDGDLTVSVAKAKTRTIGSNREGAKITVKETAPDVFEDFDPSDNVKFTIMSSGATWATGINASSVDPTYLGATPFTFTRTSDKVITLDHFTDQPANVSKLVFTPLINLAPNATGEIKVKVSGEGISTETFTVINVGTDGAAIEVTDGDATIYRGQLKDFDDVEVEIDPVVDLNSDDYFTVTLPEGLEFAKTYDDVDEQDAILENGDQVEYVGLYNSNRTAWFAIDDEEDQAAAFKLYDFKVIADANAVIGDIAVTFDGAFEGTAVIGKVASPYTVATTPFALQSGQTSVKGADIVITEAGDGVLKATTDPAAGYRIWAHDLDKENDVDTQDKYYLNIELPSGVTFNGTPTVDVTDGDVSLGDVSLEDNDTLRIEIDEQGNTASVITISDIEYSVLNQGSTGDIVARIGSEYNIAGTTELDKLTIGAVAANPSAVYVIGAPTFTVNGVSYNVVTPSYIKNGRTYLAIRDIATGLGIDSMNVLWDAASQKVTLVKGDKVVQVAIGSTTMYVNGVAVAMDVAPEISNGRTMLPAAFIAQAFGATASWDGLTSTVTIK